jgi:hypothetical protein
MLLLAAQTARSFEEVYGRAVSSTVRLLADTGILAGIALRNDGRPDNLLQPFLKMVTSRSTGVLTVCNV